MKTTNLKKLVLLASLPLLTLACSKDKEQQGFGNGKGAITISASADDAVKDMGLATVRDVDATLFNYTITGPDSFNESGTLGSGVSFSDILAGSYAVKVFSMTDAEYDALPAMNAPAYSASQDPVIVVANNTTPVVLECKQINTGIQFEFDESATNYFPNLVAIVTLDGESLAYTPDNDVDNDIAYFKPGNATLTITSDGTPIKIGGEDSKALTFAAQELWTVKLKTSLSANGNISIVATVNVTVIGQDAEFGIGEVVNSGTDAENAFSIIDAINAMPASDKFVEGYIVGTTTSGTRDASFATDNILLGMEANSPIEKCVVVDLRNNTELSAMLSLAGKPGLVGQKVILKGDVVANTDFTGAPAMLKGAVATDVAMPNLTLKDAAPFKMGVAVGLPSYLNEAAYKDAILRDYNSVSPENALKWNRIARNGKDKALWDWSEADEFIKFAEDNNLRVHGHAILWYNYQPDWIHQLAATNSDKAFWTELMVDIVKTVVGKYRGKIASWDIVNEEWADPATNGGDVPLFPGTIGTQFYNVWADKIGIEYIELAYKAAREADPDCLLFYNDHLLMYGTEANHWNRGAAIYEHIAKINETNPGLIDGIGIQYHGHLDFPGDNRLTEALTAAKESGLQVHLSEVSVKFENDWGTSYEYNATTAERQSAKYANVVKLYKDIVPAAQQFGITIWGVTDKYSFLKLEGKTDWPLLLDSEYKFKPAYTGVLNALLGK